MITAQIFIHMLARFDYTYAKQPSLTTPAGLDLVARFTFSLAAPPRQTIKRSSKKGVHTSAASWGDRRTSRLCRSSHHYGTTISPARASRPRWSKAKKGVQVVRRSILTRLQNQRSSSLCRSSTIRCAVTSSSSCSEQSSRSRAGARAGATCSRLDGPSTHTLQDKPSGDAESKRSSGSISIINSESGTSAAFPHLARQEVRTQITV